MNGKRQYGEKDASYLAAGSELGLRTLVDDFFDLMSEDPRYVTILEMHPTDLDTSRDKLARFLCGWLGGPRRYQEKYGPISIPAVHAHLNVGEIERDQWLSCMQQAVSRQPFADDFKVYVLQQLFVPAESVRRRSQRVRAAASDPK